MNNFLFNSQSEVNLNSPKEVTYTSQSYFDTITQRLDSWHAKQQAQQEKRAQVVKTFLLQDPDDVNGVVRTYRLTVELVATNQVDAHQLELMEAVNYAN